MEPEITEKSVEPLAKSSPEDVEKFKPGWRLLAAFTSIAIVNLACALDATIISVALPVSLLIGVDDLDNFSYIHINCTSLTI